jgi:hypothetical protein
METNLILLFEKEKNKVKIKEKTIWAFFNKKCQHLLS